MAGELGAGSVLGRLRALEPSALGVATELFDGDSWPAVVGRATSWSRDAVELSALEVADLDSVVAYLRDSTPAIPHLSLHAPLVLPHGGEQQLAACVNEIASRVAPVVGILMSSTNRHN